MYYYLHKISQINLFENSKKIQYYQFNDIKE